MNIQVVASTKLGYELPREDAINFGGKNAGICYMPASIDELWNENPVTTEKRARGTLVSLHHSVFDHASYDLVLTDIPKILAMVLNNEGMYTTSEKSARYTTMTPSLEEAELYEKWTTIFSQQISERYHNIGEKAVHKLALENARYLISVFTPATTMSYTVSFRQLNYIIHWFEDFIKNANDSDFNLKLKTVFMEFLNQDVIKRLEVTELNTDLKKRSLSLFDNRFERKESFSETYCTTYKGSFAQFAQEHRHRTLRYKLQLLDIPEFYVPCIIRGTSWEFLWLSDISSLSRLYPQGMLVQINERGTYEDFIQKLTERFCGSAQLETMQQNRETLEKYLCSTVNANHEVFEELVVYANGPRCTFPDWKCAKPCIWGRQNAFERLV